MTTDIDGMNGLANTVSRELALTLARAKAFRSARRHSLLVRALKILLPIISLALLGLYFVSSDLSVTIGNTKASIAGMSLSRENLTMTRPTMEGVTSDRSRYIVTAVTARQDFAKPGFVYLDTVNAQITEIDGSWVKLTANNGQFDEKKEMLRLDGDIRVHRRDGTRAQLKTADFDFARQFITSDEPVVVEMLNGDIRAQRMTLAIGDRLVRFFGNVRVHLKKRSRVTKTGIGQ